MESWRLIRSPAAGAAENMALDEALLLAGGEAPVLRLYTFARPALSLGYAQRSAAVDLAAVRAAGAELVRRPTGGRAVWHGEDLVYAIVLPAGHSLAAGTLTESYARLAAGLAAGLRLLGIGARLSRGRPASLPAACFAAPARHELLAGGKKLAGSAQARRAGRMLQQGSLPLRQDVQALVGCLAFPSPERRADAARRLAERAGSLEEAAGRPLALEEVARALAKGLAAALDVRLVEDAPAPGERRLAARLREERYSREEWTFRR